METKDPREERTMTERRDGVHKTYKLFLGGAFPRSESGRHLTVTPASKTAASAQVCRASRKDLRNAVEAAGKAFPGWAAAKAMLRGQILYRMAEMCDARRAEFVELERRFQGARKDQAERDLDHAIQVLLWHAGWADKLAQVLGSVNPVSGPWFNFSIPEPSGVVAILPPERPGLLPLLAMLAPVLVSGNTAVSLSSGRAGPSALTLAEVAATSDLPLGVWNALTGDRKELLPHFATHRGFAANFCATDDPEEVRELRTEAADHVKRERFLPASPASFWRSRKVRDLEWIRSFTEIKTAWHPIGL